MLTGEAYEELSQRDKAAKAYQAALKADPSSPSAAFRMARVAEAAGQYKAAADHLDATLKNAGDQLGTYRWAGEALLLAGDLHKRLGQRDASVAAYQRYLAYARPDAPERVTVEQSLRGFGVKRGSGVVDLPIEDRSDARGVTTPPMGNAQEGSAGASKRR